MILHWASAKQLSILYAAKLLCYLGSTKSKPDKNRIGEC